MAEFCNVSYDSVTLCVCLLCCLLGEGVAMVYGG